MARAEIITVAKNAADAWRGTDTYHQAAQIIEMLVSELEGEPTLTPPNDPLTIEQLREMDGEPVWVTPLGFWALVIAKRDERVKLISNDGEIVYADKEIELVGPVYRRPPEGDADEWK